MRRQHAYKPWPTDPPRRPQAQAYASMGPPRRPSSQQNARRPIPPPMMARPQSVPALAVRPSRAAASSQSASVGLMRRPHPHRAGPHASPPRPTSSGVLGGWSTLQPGATHASLRRPASSGAIQPPRDSSPRLLDEMDSRAWDEFWGRPSPPEPAEEPSVFERLSRNRPSAVRTEAPAPGLARPVPLSKATSRGGFKYTSTYKHWQAARGVVTLRAVATSAGFGAVANAKLRDDLPSWWRPPRAVPLSADAFDTRHYARAHRLERAHGLLGGDSAALSGSCNTARCVCHRMKRPRYHHRCSAHLVSFVSFVGAALLTSCAISRSPSLSLCVCVCVCVSSSVHTASPPSNGLSMRCDEIGS